MTDIAPEATLPPRQPGSLTDATKIGEAGEPEATNQTWPSWRYVAAHSRFRPKRLYLNFAMVLVVWALPIWFGYVVASVFDHLRAAPTDPSSDWLVVPIALAGLRAFGGAAGHLWLQWTNGPFVYANATMMQRNMLRRLLELPGSQALPGSTGAAVSRFRDDTEAVIWWPVGFNNVIGSTVMTTVAVVLMARIDTGLAAGVVIPLGTVFGVVALARNRLTAYRQANQVRTAQVTGFIGDVCTAAAEIQASGARDRVVEHYRRLNTGRRRAAVRDRLLGEVIKGGFWVSNVGTAAILVVAGNKLRSGALTVGDVALFVAMLRVFDAFARDVGDGLAGYRRLGVSYRRMHDLLAGRPAAALVDDDEIFERGPLPSATGPAVSVEPFTGLELRGVGFAWPSTGRGVGGVDLRLEPGSFTVVTGRVGSGKSTLLHCLLGLVRCEGTLVWNDHAVDDTARFMVPPRVAYTPQVPHLFSTTLADNIELGTDGDVLAAVEAARLSTDLTAMPDGLDTRIGSRGLRLSGGQVQRTAAARMFVRRPQLLVCDDLSSALDVETEAELWRQVRADRTTTVLAVSHRPAALAAADQVLVLSDGRVAGLGPLDDLLETCPAMQELWGLNPRAGGPGA